MKTPLLESLLNKVAHLQVCNFIKKKLQHRYFPVIVAKFLRIPISKNICERLLLFIQKLLKYKNCVIKNMLPESF